jgi:tripartite ATP-independent transporter DctM subunit
MALFLLFFIFLFLAFIELPFVIMSQRMASGLDSFPFLAIPLFILAGQLLNRAGIAKRIFDFAIALVGHIKGGLAHVNVIASIIFAGMSGVAQADAAGLGTVEIKAMIDDGFDRSFSAAITAASSIIGPIIPPSVIMVIFALIAELSVAKLFLGGLIPGLLMGLSLMAMIFWMASTGRVRCPVHKREKFSVIFRTFLRALPALVAPVILVAGILLGVATPTELGALTIVYALVLGFAYGELTFSKVIQTFKEALIIYGVLVFIISAAFPFGWLVAINEIPSVLADFIFSISTNKWIILLLLNFILLIAGLIMETTAILLISTPVLLPLVKSVGIDPIHFGLIMVLNLLIGANTPPFGVCLFIVMDIAKVPFGSVVKAILPLLIPLLLILFLITFIPDLVLFIPNLLLR